ncbi:MAG TPA: heme-binding protein [Bradyrhizobium sp.]
MTARRHAIIVAAALAFGATAAVAEDSATVTYKSLSPEVALEAAQAALKQCRTDGFQVAAVVVDRFGQPQVLLRDRYAGLPAADTATRKAYTALGFHAATSDLAKSIKSGSMDAGLARLPNVAMLAGGLVIEAGGTVLGGIGVAGAPGGDKDEACAKAGLDAIRDRIDF